MQRQTWGHSCVDTERLKRTLCARVCCVKETGLCRSCVGAAVRKSDNNYTKETGPPGSERHCVQAAVRKSARLFTAMQCLLVWGRCKQSAPPVPHPVQYSLISGMHWNVQRCKGASLRVQTISDATLKEIKLQHARHNSESPFQLTSKCGYSTPHIIIDLGG